MRLPRLDRDALPAAAIALTSLVLGALIFGRFLFPHATVIGFDEGYMVSFAERMIDGHWLPYVDAVSQRGPVLYWVLAVAQLLTGRYEWVGIRTVGLSCCLLTVVATYLAGVAARWPLAGAIGGAATVVVVSLAGGTLGVYGETVAAPCLAVSFALVAWALCRSGPGPRRLGLLAVAGVFAALAAMAKQTAGLASGPLVAWALVHAWSEADEAPAAPPATARLAWCLPALVFVAGWAAVLGAIVVFYAAHGALGELVYWSTTYNAAIYMLPYRDRYWHVLGAWLRAHSYAIFAPALICALILARLASLSTSRSARGVARAYARAGFEVTAALTGMALFATALLPARFWWHYFMPTWPWLGLVAGVVVELLLRRGAGATPGKQAVVATGAVMLIIAVGGRRLGAIRDAQAAGAWGDPRPDPICAHIDTYAPPGESIFVWGFDADLYITCRRKPAARFTYLTLVAGIVPPFWKSPKPEQIARGSRELLLDDLEQSRPAVILDVPIHGFQMARVPELRALLARDYCALPAVTGRQGRQPRFFGRRDLGICSEARE